MEIRQPAHAGTFYPDNPQILHDMILSMAVGSDELVQSKQSEILAPRILVAPHAGYIYSGLVAAAGYKVFKKNQNIKKIVLVGGAHSVAFPGYVMPKFTGFQTPFGIMEVDEVLLQKVLDLDSANFQVNDEPHIQDHNLEVQIPFIQALLQVKTILPILAGVQASPESLSHILQNLLEDEEVGIIISSDMSHYMPYEEAKTMDIQTMELINIGKWQELNSSRACGYVGLQAMSILIQKFQYKKEFILYMNSGDTAGDKSAVVGYFTMIAG